MSGAGSAEELSILQRHGQGCVELSGGLEDPNLPLSAPSRAQLLHLRSWWKGCSPKFASLRPYTFYPSFTKGLRLFNTEVRGKVYSVSGPGSTATFLSELPESQAYRLDAPPSTVCC
jgi:hypothetical protein